jgi:predicted ATPase
LKLIIREQPPIPEFPPKAQGRFRLAFGLTRRLDAPTLDLLEYLLTRPNLQHPCRNEVDSTHPLMRKLEAIRQAGTVAQDIVVAALTGEDLGQLIADSLHCELERRIPSRN